MNNIWQYWLEDNPRTLYAGYIPQDSLSVKNYWGNKFSDVYQDYQGKLARMALKGNPPNLNFGQYLKSYPFSEYYNLLSPQQRGLSPYLSGRHIWNV